MKPVYTRILLKLSGEGLMGDKVSDMSADVIKGLAEPDKSRTRLRRGGLHRCRQRQHFPRRQRELPRG
ncbi:MAG: hypothetical protein ACLU99_04230 [Alphaproteobacteria bacterium]